MKYFYRLPIFLLPLFIFGCASKTAHHSWASTFFYDACCDGSSSEYWNIVLADTAGQVSGPLYWGFKDQKAVLQCHIEGDSLSARVFLDQPSTAAVVKNIPKGSLLFRLERGSSGEINTIWEKARPLCPKADLAQTLFFTASQPGTIGDPCAGENNSQSVADESTEIEEDYSQPAPDTAAMAIVWDEAAGKFADAEKAAAIIKNAPSRTIKKIYDEATDLSLLTDKDPLTEKCFPLSGLTLTIKAPLPSYIINGSLKTSAAAARIKTITVIQEFETVAIIELPDQPGIQSLQCLEKLGNITENIKLILK